MITLQTYNRNIQSVSIPQTKLKALMHSSADVTPLIIMAMLFPHGFYDPSS